VIREYTLTLIERIDATLIPKKTLSIVVKGGVATLREELRERRLGLVDEPGENRKFQTSYAEIVDPGDDTLHTWFAESTNPPFKDGDLLFWN
jgi:hypothetical protein